MPPRKRAASAPKPDPDEALVEPTAEGDGEEAAADPQESDGAGSPAEPAAGGDSADPAPPGEAERSDPQTVEAPCTDCFPQGWPDQSYAVGCEHGTWTRA